LTPSNVPYCRLPLPNPLPHVRLPFATPILGLSIIAIPSHLPVHCLSSATALATTHHLISDTLSPPQPSSPLSTSAFIIITAETHLPLPLISHHLSSATITNDLSIVAVALACCRILSVTITISKPLTSFTAHRHNGKNGYPLSPLDNHPANIRVHPLLLICGHFRFSTAVAIRDHC
jgi:hypothetical protein